MSKTQFEKHITKYEVANQCLMLETDEGKSYESLFPSDKVTVRSKGTYHTATVREFYVKGKFKKGIAFEHEKGHLNAFFFENTVTETKRMILTYDPSEALVDNRVPIDIEIYIKTK